MSEQDGKGRTALKNEKIKKSKKGKEELEKNGEDEKEDILESRNPVIKQDEKVKDMKDARLGRTPGLRRKKIKTSIQSSNSNQDLQEDDKKNTGPTDSDTKVGR